MPLDRSPRSEVVVDESDAAADAWRQRVLDGVLRALLITGALGLVATTPVVIQEDVVLALAYWGALIPVGYLALARKLDYRVRLGGLLLVVYAIAMGIVLGERRLPEFGVYMISITAIGALVGGVRWGIGTLVLCGITFVAISIANVTGALGPPPAAATAVDSLDNWITFGANWALFGISLTVSIWYVIGRLERSLTHAQRLGTDLKERIREKDEAVRRQRETEAQLLQSQKMEVVGQIAGGVAHDFNNLLTAIVGGAEMAAAEADDEAAVRQWLTTIRDAADQAGQLTQQLLAFSRRDVVAPQALPLDDLVRDQQRVLARLLPDDLELTMEFDAHDQHVLVDRIRFQQVLLNLVVNARDATAGQGSIHVRTRSSVAKDELPHESPATDLQWLAVEVRDTGSGILDDDLNRIFDPFFTTKPPGQGTGLGLSTAREIVSSWGGAIAVASTMGEGSTFTVYVPACDAPSEVAGSPHAKVAAQRGSGRVLIVDDHLHVRAVMRATLEEAGYTVLDAVDGVDALDQLEREAGRVDLVISDVVMPGMTGPELHGVLGRKYPDVKILFCSGYAPDERLRRGVSEGAVALLHKPFVRAELLAKVADVLR